MGLAAVLTGCQPVEVNTSGHDRFSAPLGTISVYQLAGRLNLSVERNSRVLAILRDRNNVVMIYADPSGQAFVNGDPVGPAGGVSPVGDMLFVPETMEHPIRLALRWDKILPQPTRAQVPPQRKVLRRIVVDPGHGGKDVGAVSVIGGYEKNIVLDAALTVAAELEKSGSEVVLTRQDDTFVELNERADLANRHHADAFVSIHADSCSNPSAKGFTVYVARAASPQALELARAIESRLRRQGFPSRGIRRANYRVLVRTICPSVLVEMGYLSNASEARRLAQKHIRQNIAQAVSEGALAYFQAP